MHKGNKIYELHISGKSETEIVFSNRTRLTFDSKRISVFIQTDKVIYKPKQEVKFRVLTLFSDLKPYKTPVDIYIKVSGRLTRSGVLKLPGELCSC